MNIDYNEILGRKEVEPDKKLLLQNIEGNVVMVTGAGGSIGSELCRQVLKYKPKKLVVFDISEFALYKIDQELKNHKKQNEIEIISLLGSVQNIDSLFYIMKKHKVNVVYHTAAYKHVPILEENIIEGVRNNVFGTYYCAQAAIKAKVNNFTLISTDKAVRPTNIMGATKRFAELGLQALADNEQKKQDGTCFCIVRFGNVLGSSGSVIPLFIKQIKNGGPVTVTHPDIVRYFMTISEATQLVIQATAMSNGGEVFVLDMGQPVKIVDLAIKMIDLFLAKKRIDKKIEIKYSGLRPGEKLYEELLFDSKLVKKTTHMKIMKANEPHMQLCEFTKFVDDLDKACFHFDETKVKKILELAPLNFCVHDI